MKLCSTNPRPDPRVERNMEHPKLDPNSEEILNNRHHHYPMSKKRMTLHHIHYDIAVRVSIECFTCILLVFFWLDFTVIIAAIMLGWCVGDGIRIIKNHCNTLNNNKNRYKAYFSIGMIVFLMSLLALLLSQGCQIGIQMIGYDQIAATRTRIIEKLMEVRLPNQTVPTTSTTTIENYKSNSRIIIEFVVIILWYIWCVLWHAQNIIDNKTKALINVGVSETNAKNNNTNETISIISINKSQSFDIGTIPIYNNNKCWKDNNEVEEEKAPIHEEAP
jgi:hypothetical protein